MAEPTPTIGTREQPDQQSDLAHKREVKRGMEGIVQSGRVQWVSEFTLTADGATTTTVVVDDRVNSKSQISLHPMTPEAAAVLPLVWIAAGGLIPGAAWTSTQVGTFTVNHPPINVGEVVTFRSSTKGS
ncbi:MAG TPA: hypothetical protein VJ725_34700 [Thermoanaerobaculia bacterium]|nr:hypothetical protein [Thermoanaerobaculia bacterium]